MSTETQARPEELRAGDEFKVPSGPYRGMWVRALTRSAPGDYAVYGVRVELLTPVDVKLDYSAQLQVRRAS